MPTLAAEHRPMGDANPSNATGPPTATSKNFSLDDVNVMEAQIPGVRIAVPSGSRNMTAIYGNENYNTSVTGSDNRFFDARQWTLAQGRFFQPGELSAGSAVCVIGETVRKAIFGKSKPIGETIRLEKLSCNVVGLLASKGASTAGPDQDDIVVIPLRMFQRRVSGNRDVSSMIIVAKDGVSTTKVQRDVQRQSTQRDIGQTKSGKVAKHQHVGARFGVAPMMDLYARSSFSST